MPIPVLSDRPEPAAVPGAAGSGGPTRQFYGVYLHGGKAGWAEERVEPQQDGSTRVEVRVELRIRRMDVEMTTEMTDVTVFGPPPAEELVRFELVQRVGDAESVTAGVRGPLGMEVTMRSGASETIRTVPASRMTLEDRLPERYARRVQAAAGAPVRTWQMNPQQIVDMEVVWRLVGTTHTRLHGVPATILEMAGRNDALGLDMTNRVTAEGVALEATMGPGLRLVLEDRSVAMDRSAAAPDIYRLSVIAIDRRLGPPESVGRLRVELSGLPETAALDDARQKRTGDVVEVRRRPASELAPEELAEADRRKWLEATVFLDHGSEVVSAFAKGFLPGKDGAGADEAATVRAMTGAVRRRIAYSLATAPLTASDILRTGKGDCSEYARVLVAAARSLGMPAREVAGIAYAGDSNPGFTYHAWAEVYAGGRWITADPTWDQSPVDATHIALARDDPSAIVGLLGALRARVLEAGP